MKKLIGIVAVLVVVGFEGCKRTCDNTCINNGTCVDGTCVCPEGHWGNICQYDSCATCINNYVNTYSDAYFEQIDTLCGFCTDCIEFWMVDSARNYAKTKAAQLNCITPYHYYGKVNLTVILRSHQYDTLSASFTQHDKDRIIKLNSWLDFNPIASPGYIDLPVCK